MNPTEAYALVTATFRGTRYVLLIERGDGAGWGMPGGAIRERESAIVAAMRELRDQTGLVTAWPIVWRTTKPKDGVVIARCDLGEVDALPEVQRGDDARSALWIAIDELSAEDHGYARWRIFPAHREILEKLR